VLEELASLKNLHGTTTGTDLCVCVCVCVCVYETMKELDLPWIELRGSKCDRKQV